jgi:REP element-mobilizing transposase RayT
VDSKTPKRKSIRLQGYDYAADGAYFVTLCTWKRECTLGEINNGEMTLSDRGKILHEEWLRTGTVRPDVTVDEFVIMPNHLHGILILHDKEINVGATRRVAPTIKPGSLGAIVGQIKSIASKRIKALYGDEGKPVWQRSFYDRIIRDDRELNRIHEYILSNPSQWSEDTQNPQRQGPWRGLGAVSGLGRLTVVRILPWMNL